jgi:aqualysin 1
VADGVTFAIAAGNDSRNACNYSPARTAEAITVGSTTSSDARSSFSNFGTCVDIFAPGSSITSAWNTSSSATNVISGTSMASPHVTGVAALATQANPGASPAAVGSFVIATASANRIVSVGTGSPNLLLYSLGIGTAAEPAKPTIAVKNIAGTSGKSGRNWRANATATIYDVKTTAVMANVTVTGSFSPGNTSSCVTSGSGSCTLSSGPISTTFISTMFTVGNVSATNMIYDISQNANSQITISHP